MSTDRRWLPALLAFCACSSSTHAHLGSDLPPDTRDTSSAGSGTPPLPAAGAWGAAPDCRDFTADCDGDATNGCEADLQRDRAHCGNCSTRCPSADCACRAGELVAECRPGYADCDGDLANGCEIQIDSNADHCGGCGRACLAEGEDVTDATCMAGRCVLTCESRQVADCDGDPSNGCEANLWFDEQNCGACGMRCECEFGTCSEDSA